MNNIESVFCRLCAELKPHNKLIDLKTDENMCTEIITKLSRFKMQNNLSDNVLPKMACDSCITSINRTFDFVTIVEKAQSKLNDFVLTQQTKQEQNVSKDDLINNDASSSKKSDVQIQNAEVESEKNVKSTAKPVKMTYKKKENKMVATLTKMKLTWKSYKWLCIQCRCDFPTIRKLRTHKRNVHECCNVFKCRECKATKDDLDTFVRHIQKHKPYLRLSCYICSEIFKSVSATNKHIRETHTTTEFVCSGCNKCFKSGDELEDHTETYYK